MGAYSERIKAQHLAAGLTGNEIMAKKNRRSRERNQIRREERRDIAEQRNKHWQSLSPARQMIQLDRRLGIGKGAKKATRSHP